MQADWPEGVGKKDKNKAELEEYARKCNTKNNAYEKLYKEKYLGTKTNGGTATRTYAGAMPFYLPVLEVTFDDGTVRHFYGKE